MRTAGAELARRPEKYAGATGSHQAPGAPAFFIWPIPASGLYKEQRPWPKLRLNIQCGAGPLGEIRKAVIFLRSTSGNEFDVENTETTTDSVSVEHQTSGPLELAFAIAQKAVALGSQCGEIRFSICYYEMRRFSVMVKAIYYGIVQQ